MANRNSSYCDLVRRMEGNLTPVERGLIQASGMDYIFSLGILEAKNRVANRCILDNTPLILAPVSRIHLHKHYVNGGMSDCVLEVRSAYYGCPHCSMIYHAKMKKKDINSLKEERQKKKKAIIHKNIGF
jgi:hypothetical protein